MIGNPGDELVDVIDEQGNTIDTVTRREIRKHRLPHRCVYILVFNTLGDIFIHLRTPTKDVYPGFWDVTIGGVLSAGESFELGAQRETLEELGIAVTPQPLFAFRHCDPATQVIGKVYRVVHEGPFRLQPEEIVEGEFVRPKFLDAIVGQKPFCPDGLGVWRQYQMLETQNSLEK